MAPSRAPRSKLRLQPLLYSLTSWPASEFREINEMLFGHKTTYDDHQAKVERDFDRRAKARLSRS
jgi:hypothetical protein